MFAVEMLPGGHGDALVVEYGTKTDPHQLLIDAGTFHAWDGVRKELIRRRRDRYEIFVITHVDEDHIGGAIALLDDPNLKQRIDHVWFNGFVHCETGGNVLGPVNGEQLTSRIVRGGFRWNQGFTPKVSNDVGGPVVVPSAGDLPGIDLPGNARLVLLSPSGLKLRAMAKTWEQDVVKAGLVPGAGDFGHTTSPRPRGREFDPLPDPLDHDAIATLAAKKATDRSEANGSSIAFILEYDEKRALFGADAPAPVLTKALKRYAERVGEARPRIDLVKLAHHGSNANLSTAMLALIDSQRFLISTNGDNFDHPDDAAIAKVIATSGGRVTFFCNYRTARTAPWEEHCPGVGATFKFPKANQHFIRVAG
jgi:Metallo-beta-lactamase superfamily